MASPASSSAHSRSSAGPSGLPDGRVVSVEHEAHPVPQDHGHDQRLRGPLPAEKGQQPLVRRAWAGPAPSRTPAARPPRRRPRARPSGSRTLRARSSGSGRPVEAHLPGALRLVAAEQEEEAAADHGGGPPQQPQGHLARGATGRAAPRRWRAGSRARSTPGPPRPCGSSPRGGSGRWPLPPRPRAPRRPPRCRRPRPRARPRSGSSRSATGTAPAPRGPSAAGAPPGAGPR